MKNNNCENSTERFIQLLARPFATYNFRFLAAGQALEQIGVWMQFTAVNWLIYRLTDSPLWLGIIGFSTQIPVLLLAPFTAAISDYYNKKWILITAQSLRILQVIVLVLVVTSGNVMLWHIVLLSLFMGIINGIDNPVAQAIIFDLTPERKNLGSAIATIDALKLIGSLTGPSVAGYLIGTSKEARCLLLSSVFYLFVITFFSFIKLKKQTKIFHSSNHLLRELIEGCSYSWNTKPVKSILAIAGLFSLIGIPYTVLIPIFAKHILHGDANSYGHLISAGGTGAFCCSVWLASRKNVLGLDKIISFALTFFAAGLVMLALSENIIFSLAAMFFTGSGVMTLVVSSNSILQTITEDSKRSRVIGIYIFTVTGMVPCGSLIIGAIAKLINPVNTLLVLSGMALVGAFIWSRHLEKFRTFINPIYRQMGILDDQSAGKAELVQ